jgi:hypothetical protein
MRVRVLRTFGTARFADVRANPADLAGELAAAGHVPGGKPADRGAVHVQPDALGHHLHVLLAKASGRAVVASIRTAVARVDARLVLLMSHD